MVQYVYVPSIKSDPEDLPLIDGDSKKDLINSHDGWLFDSDVGWCESIKVYQAWPWTFGLEYPTNLKGMKPEGAPQIFHWISGGPWHLKSSKGWSQSPACRGGLLLLRKQAEWKVRVVLKDSRHGTPAVKTWGSQHRWSIASKEVWTLGKLQGRDFGIRLDPASHPASHRLNFWTCQVAWFPFDPVSPLTASAPDPPLSPKTSPQD